MGAIARSERALHESPPVTCENPREHRLVGRHSEPNAARPDAARAGSRRAAAHRRVYFHGGEAGRQLEIVGLRCGVRRPLETLPEFRERVTTLDRPRQVPVRIGNEMVNVHLFDAASLAPGTAITGPALIEGYSSSAWVPSAWTATRDAHANLIMRRTAS